MMEYSRHFTYILKKNHLDHNPSSLSSVCFNVIKVFKCFVLIFIDIYKFSKVDDVMLSHTLC